MIGDALSLIDFLQKHWAEYSGKSALFSCDGVRVEGNNFIEVDKIPVVVKSLYPPELLRNLGGCNLSSL